MSPEPDRSSDRGTQRARGCRWGPDSSVFLAAHPRQGHPNQVVYLVDTKNVAGAAAPQLSIRLDLPPNVRWVAGRACTDAPVTPAKGSSYSDPVPGNVCRLRSGESGEFTLAVARPRTFKVRAHLTKSFPIDGQPGNDADSVTCAAGAGDAAVTCK